MRVPRAVYGHRPPVRRARYSDEMGFMRWALTATGAVIALGWPGFTFADGGRWGTASWVAEAAWLALLPVTLVCIGLLGRGRDRDE